MENEKIKGGAILLARKTIESEIFLCKPAKWFKIWFFILSESNHADRGKFKRGQCFLTYRRISDFTKASKGEIDHCIRWLKSATMLATQKSTRGMVITVANYDFYQTMDNYYYPEEATASAIQKRHKSDRIHKNVINGKNVYTPQKQIFDEDSTSNRTLRFKAPTLEEVVAYRKERGNSVDPEKFWDFYQSKGWKVGNQPMKDWKAAMRNWERERKSSLPSVKENIL